MKLGDWPKQDGVLSVDQFDRGRVMSAFFMAEVMRELCAGRNSGGVIEPIGHARGRLLCCEGAPTVYEEAMRLLGGRTVHDRRLLWPWRLLSRAGHDAVIVRSNWQQDCVTTHYPVINDAVVCALTDLYTMYTEKRDQEDALRGIQGLEVIFVTGDEVQIGARARHLFYLARLCDVRVTLMSHNEMGPDDVPPVDVFYLCVPPDKDSRPPLVNEEFLDECGWDTIILSESPAPQDVPASLMEHPNVSILDQHGGYRLYLCMALIAMALGLA